MKVLHITNNYPTSSLPIFGIFVKEQVDTLNSLGIHNDIFFVNGYEKGKIEYIKSIFRLKKYLKTNKYDVIHCHHALSAFMYILTPKYKCPCVVSFQNDPVHEHGLLLFRIIRKYFDCLIFKNNSNLIKRLKKNGVYLPNGVNTDFFYPMDKNECKKELMLDPQKKYILFISSFLIRKQKRIDRFDKTMEILKLKFPNENFEELKLINTERELMPKYFNAASLHLLTSDFEGSPNSVKESISCNTPVVSTDVGNVKDMLLGATNCYVSDVSEPDVLANLVYKAVNESSNIRKTIFLKKLDSISQAKKLKSIYIDLIQKNHE